MLGAISRRPRKKQQGQHRATIAGRRLQVRKQGVEQNKFLRLATLRERALWRHRSERTQLSNRGPQHCFRRGTLLLEKVVCELMKTAKRSSGCLPTKGRTSCQQAQPGPGYSALPRGSRRESWSCPRLRWRGVCCIGSSRDIPKKPCSSRSRG